MPWSAKLVLVLVILLVIPFVGEIAAVLILFAASAPLGLPSPLVMRICAAFGLLQHWTLIYCAALVVIALAFSGFFAFRFLSQATSPQQKAYYLNASILALGTPVVLALAIFRAGKLFGLGGV
jgi:hypothetical protein